MLNRRQLFQTIAGTAVLAELPIKAKIPEKPEGVELRDGSLAEAIVKLTAQVVSESLAKQRLPRISSLPASRIVRVHDHVLDGKCIVKFDKHMEASFAVPDIIKVVEIPDLLEMYCMPAVVAIAEAMRDHAGDGKLLVAAPPPMEIAGNGMIEEIATVTQRLSGDRKVWRQSFPVSVTMLYDCDTLQQRFIVRVLYGINRSVSA